MHILHIMDLLGKLNILALPEQQTKVECASAIKALEADPSIRLGFDVCLACANPLLSPKPILCKRCKRVRYCSKKCREDDGGHSPVICSLLKLCNDDDDAEEGSGDSKDDEEAEYRVRSELESYPATLANVLLDCPTYQPTIRSKKYKQLNIHVIGASNEAELWGSYRKGDNPISSAYDAYTEALTELAESRSLSQINIVFIGPDCKSLLKEKYLTFDDDKGNCRILFEGIKGTYNTVVKSQSTRSEADIIVLFNPGLTCPDYDWMKVFKQLKSGVPYLISTNTELESIMDSQWLYENRFSASIPEEVVEMIQAERQGEHKIGDREINDELSSIESNATSGLFFAMNPWAGKRVRQSGNFGNDLFVKNHWIIGGKITHSSSQRIKLDEKDHKRRCEEDTKKKKKRKTSSALI